MYFWGMSQSIIDICMLQFLTVIAFFFLFAVLSVLGSYIMKFFKLYLQAVKLVIDSWRVDMFVIEKWLFNPINIVCSNLLCIMLMWPLHHFWLVLWLPIFSIFKLFFFFCIYISSWRLDVFVSLQRFYFRFVWVLFKLLRNSLFFQFLCLSVLDGTRAMFSFVISFPDTEANLSE